MEYVEELESYLFVFDKYENGNVMLDGTIVAEYCDNEVFANIRSSVVTCKAYKEFEIISEREAYELFCAGKFDHRVDVPLNVVIKDCEIEYMVDSKGYYQPVYMFSCEINGNNTFYCAHISLVILHICV